MARGREKSVEARTESDPRGGEQVLALLRARCDAGAAALLVTHEARHAGWADRVVFLRDGGVVDEAGSSVTPDAFMSGGHSGLAGAR